MRWSTVKPAPKEWNLWFAWYPVTIGNERVWLEWVERKTTAYGAWGDVVLCHEYCTPTWYG